METMTLDDRVVIPLPVVFKEPRLGCYCPGCKTWYDCASDAHAGH